MQSAIPRHCYTCIASKPLTGYQSCLAKSGRRAQSWKSCEGRRLGYGVPDPASYDWLRIVDPVSTPSQWLSLDLGSGELSAMALALENPSRIILLDDTLARRTAQAAGLTVWGTLRVLLEAKSKGLIDELNSLIPRIQKAGLWISDEVKQRILTFAGEASEQ